MHLTLCFIGSRPVEEIEPIAAALGAPQAPVGELFLGAPLWLPPRSPRSLALAVHDRRGELARAARGGAARARGARSTGSPSAGASGRT